MTSRLVKSESSARPAEHAVPAVELRPCMVVPFLRVEWSENIYMLCHFRVRLVQPGCPIHKRNSRSRAALTNHTRFAHSGLLPLKTAAKRHEAERNDDVALAAPCTMYRITYVWAPSLYRSTYLVYV